MGEYRLSLAQIGNVKQQYVGGQIAHREGGAVLEAHVLRHFVHKLRRDGDHFRPGFVVAKTDHSVTDLKKMFFFFIIKIDLICDIDIRTKY